LSSEHVERRLAAILAADIAGYSRLMGQDEEGTLTQLKTFRKTLVDPTIAAHRGRIVKTTGDGMLMEFASAVDAVRGAVEVQRGMAEQNASMPQDKRIEFRIGIHVGDIIIDDNDIFGDGVNIAARLEGIAEPGGVCMSDDAYRQIRGKVEIVWDDLEPQTLKNIAEPMRAWRGQLGIQGSAKASPSSLAGQAEALAAADKPSIAVLPFQNMSGDPEQEYFADGLTANLTTDLSRISGLFVIASTTAATFGGKIVDIRSIGRDLGVSCALQGGVQKAGSRVRVNVRMVDTGSGSQIWSDRFDGEQADLFEIARAAVSHLDKRGINPQAADYHIRGVAIADKPQTLDGLREQETLFRQAITLNPDNADAWARLARSVLLQRINFSSALSAERMEQKLAEGERAVEKALALDANSARAHLAEGLLYLVLRKPTECARANETAISLDRNLALAYSNLGAALINLGRPEAAFPWIMKGIQLDPLGPQVGNMQVIMGEAHFLLCQTEQAIEWLQKARASNSRLVLTHAFLAMAYAQKGDPALAELSLAELSKTGPHFRLSKCPVAPGPFSPAAYRDYYDRIILPEAQKAGLPV
jgi:class 3 adenylate cyclase/TolB-like protein